MTNGDLITVETHGHQHFHKTTGRLLMACQSVEQYPTGSVDEFGTIKYKPMQVPALLVQTEDSIELLPLQQNLYWTTVKVHPAEEKVKLPVVIGFPYKYLYKEQ